MSADPSLPIQAPTIAVRAFEDAVAAQLLRAFHAHTELEPLLKMLHSQLDALTRVCGSRYTYQGRGLNRHHAFGEEALHSATYRLEHQEEPLGEIQVFYKRPMSEPELEVIEDLLSLVMLPLTTALELTRRRAAGTAKPDDALLLIRLDDYDRISERDGETWAYMLLQSILTQVRAGLRDGDSVFQVDDNCLAVLLPGTNAERANEVALKLRTLIAALHLTKDEETAPLTACVGLATTSGAASAEAVLETAKAALAEAEAAGANQIRFRPTSSG